MTSTNPARHVESKVNMNDWADALKPFVPELSASLGEDRAVGYERVEELGLPRYKRTTQSLLDFLNGPAAIFDELGSDRFYITLIPKVEGLRRFSHSGMTRFESIDYSSSVVPENLRNDYNAVVQQYFDNEYGGTIVINPSGKIYIEFMKGKQAPVSKGTGLPEFVAQSDEFTGTMRYSFESEELRTTIYDTLQEIPHTGSGRETSYNPGYYEFVLVSGQEGQPIRPIFLDYKDEPLYHLPEAF